MEKPFVSLIIPCKNEEMFVGQCLESVLANDYPVDKMEILAIDGISSDKTLSILENYSNRNTSVNILVNPGKTFPCGVNIGIKNAKGKLIFILGAHAKYESDYITKCVKYSYQYDADNVGGIIDTVPVDSNVSGRLISSVLSSPFGVGNSKFRTGSNTVVETDTVFGGCYKREIFDKYGMFNELLVSSSDYEFNRRIRKGGAKILLFPDIHVTYFTRSNFVKFIRNNIRNGYWAVYPIAVAEHFPVNIRHLVPLFFTIILLIAAITSFAWDYSILVLSGVMMVYLITSLIFSLKKFPENSFYCFLLPFLFFCLHFTYGIGSLFGLLMCIKRMFLTRK